MILLVQELALSYSVSTADAWMVAATSSRSGPTTSACKCYARLTGRSAKGSARTSRLTAAEEEGDE
eukprot:1389705-Rhodomonas_salina.2